MKTPKKEIKELMSFENNGTDKFIVKIYRKNNLYSVIITDDAKNVNNKKVYESMSFNYSMKFFHKSIKVYADRLTK